MRIAIPVRGDEVFSPLGEAEAFHFYEDDHGRIVRQFLVPMEKAGLDSALELLEQYGIDALIAGEVSAEERIDGGRDALPRCLGPGGGGGAGLFERQRGL